MIEIKVKGNEINVVAEVGNDFLTECTAAVHALAGAISEEKGISQNIALKSLCLTAVSTESVFNTHCQRTVVRMPKGVKRDADD